MEKNEEIIMKANLSNANLSDVDEFDSYLSNAKFSIDSESEGSKMLQKMLTETAHKMKSIVKK